MSVGALLLAAGQSRRFGAEDKLLADLSGRPLVAHAARTIHQAGIGLRLAVVSSAAVAELLEGMGFGCIRLAPGSPQSASIVAGIGALQSCGATRALIVLGDMPFLMPDDLRCLLDLPAHAPACAWTGSGPVPPAVFPADWFRRLVGLTGDRGAGALLRDLPPSQRLELPADRLLDVDRPKDLLPR